ncbi:MAG: hypothetical protein ABIQ44_04420, partial [Chloroflexia bacterium]
MNNSNEKEEELTGENGNRSPFWVSNRGTRGDSDKRRSERIRLATLEALKRRGEKLSSQPPPPPVSNSNTLASSTNPNSLEFTAPPGLLPKDVRRRLQGDHMPQVTPALMRTVNWQAGVVNTMRRLSIYSIAALR